MSFAYTKSIRGTLEEILDRLYSRGLPEKLRKVELMFKIVPVCSLLDMYTEQTASRLKQLGKMTSVVCVLNAPSHFFSGNGGRYVL